MRDMWDNVRFAIVENGFVTNVIAGRPPDGMEGVCAENIAVGIGDAYVDGVFTRDGKSLETYERQSAHQQNLIAQLDGELVNVYFANALLELGL